MILQRCLLSLAIVLSSIAVGRSPDAIHLSRALDGSVAAVGATSWLTTEILKGSLAPDQCRWCERNGQIDSLNFWDRGARAAFRWSDTQSANILSNLVGFGLAPLASFGGIAIANSEEGSLEQFLDDVLLIAEATVISANLTQLAKFSFGRQRPYAHFASLSSMPLVHSTDDNTSFWSGHTSIAFSLASSAATLAYLRGYRSAPFLLGVGLGVGTLTAYLRIAADRHYLSDVVVGAIVGGSIGFLVPYWFHSGRSGSTADEPKAQLIVSPTQVCLLLPF